jgi:hypothetical protein
VVLCRSLEGATSDVASSSDFNCANAASSSWTHRFAAGDSS